MRPTVLLFSWAIIQVFVTSSNCQNFNPCYFRQFLIHAKWTNIQKLSQNLNKDKTVAQLVTRIKNWTSKNFGTVSVKSDTLLDNRTYVVDRLTEFVTIRFKLKSFMNQFYKNQLSSEIGAADAQKVVNAFWRFDHYYLGVNQGSALYDVESGAHSFVAAKYKDKVMGIMLNIYQKAMDQMDKLSTNDIFYFRPHTMDYTDAINKMKGLEI